MLCEARIFFYVKKWASGIEVAGMKIAIVTQPLKEFLQFIICLHVFDSKCLNFLDTRVGILKLTADKSHELPINLLRSKAKAFLTFKVMVLMWRWKLSVGLIITPKPTKLKTYSRLQFLIIQEEGWNVKSTQSYTS